jgi:DNA-binding NarL/FixJ family response regulator
MIDIGLPDASGMELVEAKAGLPGSPRFFILTMEADASLARRAFRAGASGFASKNISLGVLALAVRLVAAGELYAEGEILRDLLTSETHFPGERPDLKERLASLTDRERAVLDAVLEGLSAKEAASRLGVSYRTAENYQSAVYAKMGARTAVELVKLAMGAGVPLPG